MCIQKYQAVEVHILIFSFHSATAGKLSPQALCKHSICISSGDGEGLGSYALTLPLCCIGSLCAQGLSLRTRITMAMGSICMISTLLSCKAQFVHILICIWMTGAL